MVLRFEPQTALVMFDRPLADFARALFVMRGLKTKEETPIRPRVTRVKSQCGLIIRNGLGRSPLLHIVVTERKIPGAILRCEFDCAKRSALGTQEISTQSIERGLCPMDSMIRLLKRKTFF